MAAGPFATPVPVTAGTCYVASYLAPPGHFSVTTGGLPDRRLAAAAHRHRHRGSANGVFTWVRVGSRPLTGPAPTTGSTSCSTTARARAWSRPPPGGGSNESTPDTSVTATFDEAVDPGTLVVDLRDGGGGVVVAGALRRCRDAHADLRPGRRSGRRGELTATVQAARDAQGNALAMPVSWSFAVVGDAYASLWDPTTTPGTLTADDAGPLNLGLRFRVSVAGSVHGVRFYKGGPGNAGPHVGSLWAADGTELASLSFGGETARGWQVATFSSPVPVEPGATYVVSYFAPYGHYSVDGGYFASDRVCRGAPGGAAQRGGGRQRAVPVRGVTGAPGARPKTPPTTGWTCSSSRDDAGGVPDDRVVGHTTR